eukprot:2637665-Pyramimonas_sp.AAC.1
MGSRIGAQPPRRTLDRPGMTNAIFGDWSEQREGAWFNTLKGFLELQLPGPTCYHSGEHINI